ncbi:MAG: alcohol dehydrogenase catalytic domain-containing protein [Chloroflexi bacterium]|nr:alcohol dehydrogenase catalytic domain-containing protein [Chloroflexota bacterium]
MLAVGMLRDKPGVHAFDLPMPEIKQPDEVLVRVKEVGLDGTDYNMLRYGLQDIAPGRNEIVLGHEVGGVVEKVGSAVTTLAPGDPVTLTVRRGCEQCFPCLHDQSDMCMTGLYTERGIHKLDGFLTQFVVERERYVVKMPNQLKRLAMFVEPLSIAEKGIEQIKTIQSRFPWSCSHPAHSFRSRYWGGCKTALVVGAGPLGILATTLFRLAKTNTFVCDILPEDHPKARLVQCMNASYIDARHKSPEEIVDIGAAVEGSLDMIFEASGAAETAIRLILYMSRSSIYVMTGIPRGDLNIRLDAAQLVRQLVRYNQVIVGSVNSNRSHFERACRDMVGIDTRFKGVLEGMITRRFGLNDYQQAFTMNDPRQIKTVIEVEPWD